MRHHLRTYLRKPYVVITIGALLVTFTIIALRNGGHLEFLELAAYDLFVRIEPKLVGENKQITIIEISEKDIHALGRWPVTDSKVAQGLERLMAFQPRAIGVDIYRDIAVPPGTAELERVFRDNPQIIGVMTVGDKGVEPLATLKGTDQAAFGDIIVDPGGIVRRGLLYLDDGQQAYTSLALRLATLFLEAEGVSLQPDPANPQLVRLKDTTILPVETNDGGYRHVDARGYQFMLDFAEADRQFRTFSFAELLAGKVPAEAIRDRIVLVGVNAESVKDHFFTPLSRGFANSQHLAGVALHGQIVSQLLRFATGEAIPVKTPTEVQKTGWCLLWGLIGGVIGFSTRSSRRFALLALCGLSALFVVSYCVFELQWWIPVVPPALSFFLTSGAVTAYMTGLEKRERTVLMQIFSKHVSPQVAEMIWQQRDAFLDNGRPRSQKLTATVFFSDLRGFTTMSERLDPQELIDWLNVYMESMASLIMKHGGVVDSYAGDGIKADFGVPLPRENDDEIRRDAENAVRCALAMDEEMRRLNATWSEKGHPVMGMRVGIYTGPVVGGLLGSSQRLKYTTIGDTVNIASRLESYDKEIGKDALCRILIGDSTLQLVKDRFKTECIGDVSLKGKEQQIFIHRVHSGAEVVAEPG